MTELEDIKIGIGQYQTLEQRLTKEYHEKRDPLRARIKELRLKRYELEFGAKVGAIVRKTSGFHTDRILHRIISVEICSWSDGRPNVWANPIRKDGTYGTAKRHLFSNEWELDDIKVL